MKSVLLITNKCTPTPSSNAACIMRLAEALRKQDIDVAILSIHDKEQLPCVYGERFFSLGIERTTVRVQEKLFGYVEDKGLVDKLVRYALKLNEELHFDLVLGAFRPIESVLASIEIAKKLDICGVACFFDLPVLHGLQTWKNTIFDLNFRRLYKRIIRDNKLIALKYYKRFFDSRLNAERLSKVSYIGVPSFKVAQSHASQNTAHPGIRIVYTGSFYKRIRDPRKMFNHLKPIIGTDIVLNLYSWGCEDVVDEYKKIFGDNLVCYGKVPYDVAYKAVAEADVLLNLSNDDEYQVPGKIMEYFSFGKAVLNFKFRDDDAGNCEYERYPLIYNVNLSDAENNLDIVKVIRSFSGKRVSAEGLSQLYFDSTPEYVVSLLQKTHADYRTVRVCEEENVE